MATICPIYVCSVLVVVFEWFCGDIVGLVDFRCVCMVLPVLYIGKL